MQDTKKLLEENKKLLEEIQYLQKKIDSIKIWGEKEVREQAHKIARLKTKHFTSNVREDFLKENIEEVIASRINNFFGDLLLLNAPKGTIESITTAEINFYNMTKNPSIDGFSVVSAYHKVLDLFIESFITNNFRKFAKKRGCTILRVNDPLEKSLNLIINKKYILSVGRLYGLLKLIKEDDKLYDFSRCFKEYLEKYSDLGSILLEDSFFDNFTKITKSEVLSKKRHSGSINKKDTVETRKVLIGDFKDKNSMIYKLLESQSVM